MTTYKSFDRQTVAQFRKELNLLLHKFGEETGLIVTVGNIRFTVDGTSLRTRLEAAVKGAKSTSAAQEGIPEKLISVLKMNGLQQTFNCASIGEVTLVDYKSSNRKYPFIGVAKSTGKRYKFDWNQVRFFQNKPFTDQKKTAKLV